MSVLTFRKSGRRTAMEEAMRPVPGSAVVQIVALIPSTICSVRHNLKDTIFGGRCGGLATKKKQKEGKNLRLTPPCPIKVPFKNTMRIMLDTLPMAPSAITRLTEILDRRSRSLSRRMKMGIKTNVQSERTLSVP